MALVVIIGKNLNEPWAVDRSLALPILAALFFASRKANVQVRFRTPKDDRERRFVTALKIMQSVGVIAMIISITWLYLKTTKSDFSLLSLQLSILLIAVLFQAVAIILYRPFVIRAEL